MQLTFLKNYAMKRDLTLIRGILLDIENAPAGQYLQKFEFEGIEQLTIAEHVDLLIKAGYLEGHITRTFRPIIPNYVVYRMTWAGHEFLANAKNDTVWKKVMVQAEEKGMSTSMTILNALLEAAAKKYAGLE